LKIYHKTLAFYHKRGIMSIGKSGLGGARLSVAAHGSAGIADGDETLSNAHEHDEAPRSLSAVLSKKAVFKRFSLWVCGDTPLITHAWSEKARREMLAKQVKAVKAGREARNPQEDFVSSLYEMGDGVYGFPATGFKNAILSVAHKDKGIARSAVMAALWIDAEMVRSRPALAGAICDMPLTRIYGSQPEMREDMVRVGAGLNKTASLAYRAQFTVWAFKITGKFNSDVLTEEALAFLIDEAGMSSGIGEWRNEKKGMFGAFHRATMEEDAEWEAFAAGRGPMPVPASYLPEAAE
jgi:hypothetical protein